MISSVPMPGNPWPHDMVLTIEDDLQSLLDLLWVREAWGLDVVGDDLPPRLVDTPVAEPTSATEHDAWSAAWPELWRVCLAHAGEERDTDALDRLHDPSTGLEERPELLARLVGPSWRDAFGDAAFTERHDAWTAARFEERTSPEALRRDPERQQLEELVPAWRAGLTRIIVVPCRGTATRRVGEHGLLVTATTRDAPDTYAEALRSFVGTSGPR